MSIPENLFKLCHDEQGTQKSKEECRAAMINHLILEEGRGVDESEDLAESVLRELWPMPIPDWGSEAEIAADPETSS